VTVIGRGWDRLTLPGKIVFTMVPLLISAAIKKEGYYEKMFIFWLIILHY
jgi:hypothetical protein